MPSDARGNSGCKATRPHAERLVRLLGPVGTNVLMRLSAFIMLCIGIQILWSGWGELTGVPH